MLKKFIVHTDGVLPAIFYERNAERLKSIWLGLGWLEHNGYGRCDRLYDSNPDAKNTYV